MKKQLFFLFAMLIAVTTLFAADFEMDGIAYNILTENTVEVTSKSPIYSGSVVIPETVTYNSTTYSVTTIGDWAFKNCIGLTSVTIGNSVTTIGFGAFNGCTSLPVENNIRYADTYLIEAVDKTLSTYTIKDGTTWIGPGAFSSCSNLTSITIPNSVTTIGYSAFFDCSGLTSVTIPNSVTTIEDNAFYGCSGLTSVTIPNSVTTIGVYAFLNVNNIVYNGTATWESWSKYWGAKCVNGYVEGYLVYSDATKTTLCGCSTAATGEITVPNSVTTIGDLAFSGCSSLTSIEIPNSVTKIGYGTFSGCHGLTSVTIPNSVTTIEEWAFGSCTGLTSVTIGNSVTTIGNQAFEGCSGLTSIDVDAANTHYCSIDGVLFDYAKNTIIQYPIGNTRTEYTIPNSVTTIGEMAFGNCSGLTSVTIPNSVTTIGYSAFVGCSSLTSITIPNSVTTIESSAFRDCSGLTSITCYAQNPPLCESYCFYGVPKNIPLYIPCNASLSAYQSAEGWKDFINIVRLYSGACGKDLHWKYKEGTLSVSGTGEMYDFTQTDSPWLELKDSVTKIVFPSNITSIGKNAFYGFSKLTSITIPNSVSTIGGEAFAGCNNITSVNWNAKNCNSWNFGSQVESFTFGNEVEIIPNELCKGMSKLTSIVVPNTTITIGELAFENCTYLKTITLGKSLADIGCNAFKGDFRIEEITSYAEVTPNVCSSTFDGLSKQYIYLYVPENSIRGYQVDPNWSEFDIRTKSADVTPMDDDNPIVTPSDQDVTITWPITDGTDTYTLTITKNGETVCVLTFNANGQLTNIAFAAPGHNGAHQAPAATLTAQGYQFTITGLNPGTAYDYSVTATDAGGQTLAEHKGNFSTTGGTGFKSVHDSQCTMHKVLCNGQILLERNNATYTLMGQKVR